MTRRDGGIKGEGLLSRPRERRTCHESPKTVPAVVGDPHAAPENDVQLRVSPRKVFLALVTIAVAHVCASLAADFANHYTAHGYAVPDRIFDLGSENNLPTYFSSVNLLACGILLFFIYRGRSQVGDRYARYWAGLSLLFLFLSIDEAASIHETFGAPVQLLDTTGDLRRVTGAIPLWVIPGSVAVAVLGLLYLRFLLALPRTTRNLFVLAVGLYVSGALGLEIISWRQYNPAEAGHQDLTYKLFVTGEEGLEMVGVIVFLYSLLSYLAARGSVATVRFGA